MNRNNMADCGTSTYQEKITKEIGFTRSIVDMCVLYIRKTMYTLYTDKSILVSPDQE